MNKVKRQHYVPEFYLRRFTNDGEHIFVYDKVNNKIFNTNVSNVASEGYFYDIDWHRELSDLDPQLIEKELSRIESLFSSNIDEIIREVDERKDFSAIDLNIIGNFIVIQWLRTRSFRDAHIKNWKELLKEELEKDLMEQGIDLSKYEYAININEGPQAVLHNYIIFNWPFLFKVLNLIKNHIWFIGINNTENVLLTSDNPVILNPHLKCDGIASEGIEIAVPLTPKHILILWERTYFRSYQDLDCRANYIGLSKVDYYNKLQIEHSYRQIFSSIDNFQDYVETGSNTS